MKISELIQWLQDLQQKYGDYIIFFDMPGDHNIREPFTDINNGPLGFIGYESQHEEDKYFVI